MIGVRILKSLIVQLANPRGKASQYFIYRFDSTGLNSITCYDAIAVTANEMRDLKFYCKVICILKLYVKIIRFSEIINFGDFILSNSADCYPRLLYNLAASLYFRLIYLLSEGFKGFSCIVFFMLLI